MAARIGHAFRIDPVAILDSGQLEWLVRIASYKVIQRDKEEEARAANKG